MILIGVGAFNSMGVHLVTYQYPHEVMGHPIPSLLPRDPSGCRFVIYGDSCSGIPGALHESTFASVNAAVSRMWPPPDFMCFLGDEISGLTGDHDALRAQWRHWFESEMCWLDRNAVPLYHVASNHTVYDEESEAVFQNVMAHLPRNGPPQDRGLSYFIRRGQVLLVFINTSDGRLGGDGWVDTEWLDGILSTNADATYKLVLGHQPVFPVNGYVSPRMCEIEPRTGRRLWDVFGEHGVLAYLCSHMLCFDAQVHSGVLQVVTSGAGTAHLSPEDYLHFTQIAIDRQGIRLQTVDPAGRVRERFCWPPFVVPRVQWETLNAGVSVAPALRYSFGPESASVLFYDVEGVGSVDAEGRAQTIFSAWSSDVRLSPLWIGFCGMERELTVRLTPVEGRSPQLWRGPGFAAAEAFSFQLAIHLGLGPGGILWRRAEAAPWSSLSASSTWGPERLQASEFWSVGHDRRRADRDPFRGCNLRVMWHSMDDSN